MTLRLFDAMSGAIMPGCTKIPGCTLRRLGFNTGWGYAASYLQESFFR
ncbi:MAG TPA: hypothetical protein VLH56_07500 [Dissulfurispiraceae bacterium]|nr:hypothetical protein [Dissulfurispiraceae bacterium]